MLVLRAVAAVAAVVLLTSLAGPARAAGVILRWDQCLHDEGAINKNFACDTNVGSHVLVGSVYPTLPLHDMSGAEIVIDLAGANPTLPAWWQFKNVGTCRQTSLSLSSVIQPTAFNCSDWSNGAAAGGIGAYSIGNRGANTARIVAAVAVPSSALAELVPCTEYFLFLLTINHLKTVGTGSCAGCVVPVCIVFNKALLTTPIPANNKAISGPVDWTDSNVAYWQGGGLPMVGGSVGCPAATPTRASTWGAVKALYR